MRDSPSARVSAGWLGHEAWGRQVFAWLVVVFLALMPPILAREPQPKAPYLVPPADSFNPGANGVVYALAWQSDGKVLAGGNFTTMGGQPRSRIARFHANGTVDTNFTAEVNATVYALAVQRDGKVVVGGDFTTVNGQIRSRLARLNADGTLDVSFIPAGNGAVYALAIQADDKILMGGAFTAMGGQIRNHLARLHATGTLDGSFTIGADNYVYSLALQANGTILLGGAFRKINGQPFGFVARIQNTGIPDSNFGPQVNSPVYALAWQKDGKILLGGEFTSLGSQRTNAYLGRLNGDGSLDTNFNAQANGRVHSLALQTDGKILAGGVFTTLNGQARNRLGRLHAAGTVDTGFTSGANNAVHALLLQSDGMLVVGGEFTMLAIEWRNQIGRLNATEPATQQMSYDGRTVTWLRGGTGPEVWHTTFEYSVDGLLWHSLGSGSRIQGGWQLVTGTVMMSTNKLIRARGFLTSGRYNGSSGWVEAVWGNLFFWTEPTSLTVDAATPATFSVRAGGTHPLRYQWQKDGLPLVDGTNISGAQSPTLTLSNVFRSDEGDYVVIVSDPDNDSITSKVAQLTVRDPVITSHPASQTQKPGQSASLSVTAAGTAPLLYQWWKDGVALPGATNAALTFLSLQGPEAGLYMMEVSNAYGSVTSIVAELAVNLTTVDHSFNVEANGSIHALALQDDGKIIAGGEFTSLGGQACTNFVRLNADGTVDSSFNPGTNGPVMALAIQVDGKILLGNLTGTGLQILRLNTDGSKDTRFTLVGATGSALNSIHVQPDGKILVAGSFNTVNGQPRNYIARLNPDGSLDMAFRPSVDGNVSTMAVQRDGKILIGGNFYLVNNQSRLNLARLHEDGMLDSSFNPRANQSVDSLAVQPDGKILAGGSFGRLAGQTHPGVGRLNGDGTLDTSFAPHSNSPVTHLTLQADGKILVVGYFNFFNGYPRNRIARLHANGTLDRNFNPGANDAEGSLAITANGNLVMEEAVWEQRSKLIRLNNTEPATESLRHEGSTATWLRGGTSPEVWRTTFDYSSNGLHWTSLGEGTRIPGGWQVTNAGGPLGTLRARGVVTGGRANGSEWVVEESIGLPAITESPAHWTNNALTVAVFSAGAVGSGPLSFQWLKDGQALVDGINVAGAQTAILTLSQALKGEEGGYGVVVSNPFGSVTSAVATLTVVDPVITSHPISQSRDLGQSVTFTAAATGTAPLHYQWWKDGVALAGATNTSLAFSNLQSSDGGLYTLVVSNTYGSVTSMVAELAVNLALVDGSFNAGTNVGIVALAIQPDGKVLVGGGFITLSGQARTNLARLNADGTVDNSFNPGKYGSVSALAIQANEKILIGGNLTVVGRQYQYILRLNRDGSLDPSFTPVTGTNSNINISVLHAQPDGKILVGGTIMSLNGERRDGMARLSPDGSLDMDFHPVVNLSVYTLATQPDGKVLIGGNFTRVNDQACTNIARLHADGTLDSLFNPGANASINTLAVQADGKILAGGYFTALGGQTRNRIGRLHADGAIDSSFDPGADNTVISVILQADGKILVGGGFTMLGGQSRIGIARLHADGVLDSNFNPGTNGVVRPMALATEGKIVMGEVFTLSGQQRIRLVRLHNTEPATQSLIHDGSTITWLRGGTSPEVWCTTFEFSADEVHWTRLGEGTRISNGWQLTGVNLPVRSTLRARGFVSSRRESWFVESLLAPPAGPYVGISPAHGFVTLQINGEVGRQYHLDYASELGSSNAWSSLGSLVLTNSPQNFRDETMSNAMQRFYRARESQ